MSFRAIMLAVFFTLSSCGAFAHGGKTDSKGCHHDKKRGDYHCH